MRTSFNAATATFDSKAIMAYSKNQFLFFSPNLLANDHASDAFSFDGLLRSVHSSSITERFVPTFSFVRTMCERDRIARFSCTTLEILSVPQTDRSALDRRAFHYIRWYYLKRKTALFQILLCCVSQASTRDLFALHYVKLITSYATNAEG